MLSIHPAAAEDNAAWFGSTFKGSNYGLGAGTMMKLGAGRHEGQARRRTSRGTQVASLGNRGYAVADDEEAREERSAKRTRNARRTRTASLGDTTFRASPTVRSERRTAKRRVERRTREHRAVPGVVGDHAPAREVVEPDRVELRELAVARDDGDVPLLSQHDRLESLAHGRDGEGEVEAAFLEQVEEDVEVLVLDEPHLQLGLVVGEP